jgi:hypothetical protein
MTNTASAHTSNFWGFDFAPPQPTLDADLLRQLNFVPGLKEILMLRQVHALEHATVWVLGERYGVGGAGSSTTARQLDNDTLGGLSTDQGFYLYGQVHLADLRRAVPLALQRLTQGRMGLGCASALRHECLSWNVSNGWTSLGCSFSPSARAN